MYVLNTFNRNLSAIYIKYLYNPEDHEDPEYLGMELHILTSAAKSVSGWNARDAIQSCREACAGHGFLKGIL